MSQDSNQELNKDVWETTLQELHDFDAFLQQAVQNFGGEVDKVRKSGVGLLNNPFKFYSRQQQSC